jgi:pimeloyl-ACP methyl ester carboxylesterase
MRYKKLRGEDWPEQTAVRMFETAGRNEVLVSWHWDAGIMPQVCKAPPNTPDPKAYGEEYLRQWPAWAPSHLKEHYETALGKESDLFKDFVTDLRMRLDMLGFDDEPINVVGHSLGGALTIAAAQKGAPFDNMSLLQAAYDRNEFKKPMPNLRGNITNNWSHRDGPLVFFFNPLIGHKSIGNTSRATRDDYMPTNLIGTGRVRDHRTHMGHNEVLGGPRAENELWPFIVDQVGGGKLTTPLWAALHGGNPADLQAGILQANAPWALQWIHTSDSAEIIRPKGWK